jgi:hypothetical protein
MAILGAHRSGVDSDEVKLEGRGAERVELNAELRPEVVEVPAVLASLAAAGSALEQDELTREMAILGAHRSRRPISQDSDEVKLEGRGAERVELNAELRPEVVEVPAVDLAPTPSGVS